MFFVPLHVGMKNVFTSITALLLVIWYSLSVIGFDVHTCSSSGNTYIATVIGGTECKDIHPEHSQKSCSCCHHKHSAEAHDSEQSLKTKPCCTDEWQMIVLTGLRTSDEQMTVAENACDRDFCSLQPKYDNCSLRISAHGRAFYKPDSGGLGCLNFQEKYSIWRI